MSTSLALVDTLRRLHAGPEPLVLPNVWDASTAKTVAAAGFPAVATSSGAVAESLGFADHQQAPVDEMLAAARRVVHAVDLPVTVDFEAGYGLEPDVLAARLVAAGVAGFNIEDTDHDRGTLSDVDAHAERLRHVRAALDASGAPLVMNARVDAFLRDADHAAVLDDGITRARAYAAAGADCVYPIVLADRELVRRFVEAVDPTPVNVLLTPAAPTIAELRELGVRRISVGGGMFRTAGRFVGDVVAALHSGDASVLFGGRA
jgi:2-methylisocitrate lyase-like PEP mutase family enzyme